MEQDLEPVVRHLVEQRWPFRLHATYDESISRMLDVFEKVNRDIPFNGLPWFFDHAETISPKNIERVRARSEEHTSELQSLMRISYAVFCLKKKKKQQNTLYQKRQNTTRQVTRR